MFDEAYSETVPIVVASHRNAVWRKGVASVDTKMFMNWVRKLTLRASARADDDGGLFYFMMRFMHILRTQL